MPFQRHPSSLALTACPPYSRSSFQSRKTSPSAFPPVRPQKTVNGTAEPTATSLMTSKMFPVEKASIVKSLNMAVDERENRAHPLMHGLTLGLMSRSRRIPPSTT